MPEFDRHIFVCTNRREPDAARPSCSPDGKGELHSLLKDRVRAAKLPGVLRVNKSGCLEQCEHGPTMVVYPEQVWYGFVKAEDLDEIVEEHLRHGRPVGAAAAGSGLPEHGHLPASASSRAAFLKISVRRKLRRSRIAELSRVAWPRSQPNLVATRS